MREITTHHDGHGLNESIEIEADDPGPGGASHHYNAVIREDEVYISDFDTFTQWVKTQRKVEW